MITFTLLLWFCGLSGCHAEAPRPVYQHLTEQTCHEMLIAETVSAGQATNGVWTQATCRVEKGKR